MATSYTTNYNLKKPDPDDFVNIGDLNSNADLIDAALAAQAGARQSKRTPPPTRTAYSLWTQQMGTQRSAYCGAK